jgi:hypothetical protein
MSGGMSGGMSVGPAAIPQRLASRAAAALRPRDRAPVASADLPSADRLEAIHA